MSQMLQDHGLKRWLLAGSIFNQSHRLHPTRRYRGKCARTAARALARNESQVCCRPHRVPLVDRCPAVQRPNDEVKTQFREHFVSLGSCHAILYVRMLALLGCVQQMHLNDMRQLKGNLTRRIVSTIPKKGSLLQGCRSIMILSLRYEEIIHACAPARC
jgi:hypothetical protein